MDQDNHPISYEVDESDTHFGDVFSRIVGKYSLGQLSSSTGIPKQTLVSWKQSRVRRPRSELQIFIVAAVLRWDRSELNQILLAAEYPEISNEKIDFYLKQMQDALRSADGNRERLQKDIELLEAMQRRLHIPSSTVPFNSSIKDQLRSTFPTASSISATSVQATTNFFGRDAIVEKIMGFLTENGRVRMVAIDGIGGIGKTTLAKECAERARQVGLFDETLWIQAPRKTFTASSPQEESFTFERVLDSIASQLTQPALCQLPIIEKVEKVKTLLSRHHPLLILDNLETAAQNQNEIIELLHPLMSTGKVLLTSRHRFTGDALPVHLEGLDHIGAIQMICQEADEKGIEFLATTNREKLIPIVETTGGSPLAIKLVVGQLGHLPLDSVLNRLRTVQLQQSATTRDEYSQLYKFIFFPSWDLLSTQGKKLLLGMTHFVPGIGGDYQAIQFVSGLLSFDFARVVDELWKLSFVEVGKPASLDQKRYYLHALTQHFVLSDIMSAEGVS